MKKSEFRFLISEVKNSSSGHLTEKLSYRRLVQMLCIYAIQTLLSSRLFLPTVRQQSWRTHAWRLHVRLWYLAHQHVFVTRLCLHTVLIYIYSVYTSSALHK